MLLLLQQPIHSPVAIRLTFEEKGDFEILQEKKISLLELSNFIYDFSLLHDCLALSTIDEYKKYYFSHYFWYRNGRPLQPEHKLYLNKINHNSPLALEVVIPLTAAVLGMPLTIIKGIEMVRTWKIKEEKLKLEVEKLHLEVNKENVDSFKQDIELQNVLLERESLAIFNRIVRRIEERQLTATDIEVTILDKKKNDNNTTETDELKVE